MPGTDSHNLAGLHPCQLPSNRFGDYFTPGHCPRLSPHPPLDVLHRAALADLADMFKCLCPGHLQCCWMLTFNGCLAKTLVSSFTLNGSCFSHGMAGPV